MQIQVANIVTATEAEGPGCRFALWLQGCPLRCPGCCNPEMLSFSGGTAMSTDEVIMAIKAARDQHNHLEGLTLLGGEPFAHAAGAAMLATATQLLGLSVMVFSGHTIEELRERRDRDVDELLAQTDILVDGPYIRDCPDPSRRWIGSTNQRIHFLSDRYRTSDECWRLPDTLEIRLSRGELAVNGFPARKATGLWKRPQSKPMDR